MAQYGRKPSAVLCRQAEKADKDGSVPDAAKHDPNEMYYKAPYHFTEEADPCNLPRFEKFAGEFRRE